MMTTNGIVYLLIRTSVFQIVMVQNRATCPRLDLFCKVPKFLFLILSLLTQHSQQLLVLTNLYNRNLPKPCLIIDMVAMLVLHQPSRTYVSLKLIRWSAGTRWLSSTKEYQICHKLTMIILQAEIHSWKCQKYWWR